MDAREAAAPKPVSRAGPAGLPFLGQSLKFAKDPLGFLCGIAREYGDIASFALGGNPVFLIALLAVSVVLGACATEPRSSDPNVLEPGFPSLPPARMALMRSAVGVFYTAEFSRGTMSDRGAPEVLHRPGPASVALFDHVLASAFERVVRLSTWPPPAPDVADAALVFVPRIAGVATIRDPSSETAAGFSGRLIEYGVDLYTPAGARVDSWTLYARSRMEGAWTPRQDALYPAAFRDAAAQLLTSIVRRPALVETLPVAPAGDAPGRAPAPHPASRGSIRLAITSVLEPAAASERKSGTDAICLADTLSKAVPGVSIVPLEEIRDALFPWFEVSTLMDTAQRMPDLMRQRAVRDGFEHAGVDYMALIHSERTSSRNPDALRCDTTYRAPGCSGVRGDALKTRLQVTLWNLRRFTMSAKFEVESAGSATIAGLAVPIAGAERSSASACERAAAAISHLIRPQ